MRGLVSFFLVTSVFLSARAETDNSLVEKVATMQKNRSSDYALDFSINSFANNYGLGVGASTPYFFGNVINFRLSGAYAWVQGVEKAESTQTWAPYGIIRLGAYSSGFVYGTVIRGYGGGGPLVVIPSSTLSEQKAKAGGFGLVGLEFPLGEKAGAMYMELGGMGTGAKADKLKESPIYANGFLASWGFRYLM